MNRFAEVTTERLVLRAVCLDDLDATYVITSDPRSWRHEPHHRHTSTAVTRGWIERAVARWALDGLSYWSLRKRDHDEVIGIGGVQRRGDRSWNLFYRLHADSWGFGYATEMSVAALGAAGTVDPEVAVTAWILEQNHESRRVAERLGLINRGLRLDPSDAVMRLVYSDRALPAPG